MQIAHSVRARGRIALAALVAAAALLLLPLGTPSQAQAAYSTYCGGYVAQPWSSCTGASRSMYAVYGWGDHAGVCVSGVSPAAGLIGGYCVGGAGQGVYRPFPDTYYWKPWIQNNSGKVNTLHGIAYQP